MTARTEAARAVWRQLLVLLGSMPLTDAHKLAATIRRDVEALLPIPTAKDRRS